MKLIFAIIPSIVLLAGCSPAMLRDVKSASLQLQLGMTEKEAITVVGFPPNMAELSTCGEKTKSGAWTCRKLTFEGLGNEELSVLEYHEKGTWRVNSWSLN